MRDTSQFNPVADQLDEMTRPLLEEMEAALDAEVGFRWEHQGFHGFKTIDDSEDSFSIRAATNEECASIGIYWFSSNPEFDLRLNLPHQFAQWLREQAEMMECAARAVEAVEDTRNLNRIIAIVGAVPSVEAAA